MCVMSLLSFFVFAVVIGTINAVYADSQKTQELQLHLDKVMNELNNNNTQDAKMHLQGALMMIASMYEGNNSTLTNQSGVTNHTG